MRTQPQQQSTEKAAADDQSSNSSSISLLSHPSQHEQNTSGVVFEDEDDDNDGDNIGTKTASTAATTSSPSHNKLIISHEVPPELLFTNTPEEGADYFDFMQDPYASSPGSKYPTYHLPVEHEEGDRAMEIRLFSWKRPHMRALHCAWISFFLAFTIWFSPSPLLKEMQDTLGLTKKEIWNSSITNDGGSAVHVIVLLACLCFVAAPTACQC